MATSEPSSTTIASEPSTSTSEIQTDTSEPSQLEVLALNYLRNQEISTIPSRIPKLNPCSICRKAILKFRFQSFVVLDCEHLFHRLCLERYIMQAETDPFTLTCPSCNIAIELTREEAVLASGEYHFRKKQTGTRQDDEELMASLGLVEGDSRAGQGSQSKQVTMQDQATSPIMIEDDASDNNDDERTPDANVQTNDDTRNRSSQQSSRGSSPRKTRSQDRFQELLRELSTPVRGEPVEANDEEETGEDSVPKSLARLYQKAMKAGLRATKANQEEISCWYNYAKGCEDRVKAIRESDSRLNGQQAMTQVYNEVKAHLPDITMANLRKKTQKARVIYKLFVNIGVGKIKRIKTYSADALSRLTDTQINSIIANFSE